MRPSTILVTSAAVGLFAAGCATQGPRPNDQMTRARTLIEQAEKSEAQRYAAPDLQRARDELNSAQVADAKGDYNAAFAYAESAAADADVAAARASAGEALRAARDARQSNSVLQQESERAAQGSSSTAPASPPDLERYPPAAPASPAPPPPEASSPEPQPNPQ
jgi:Domain of unknown function (DUF4398)